MSIGDAANRGCQLVIRSTKRYCDPNLRLQLRVGVCSGRLQASAFERLVIIVSERETPPGCLRVIWGRGGERGRKRRW